MRLKPWNQSFHHLFTIICWFHRLIIQWKGKMKMVSAWRLLERRPTKSQAGTRLSSLHPSSHHNSAFAGDGEEGIVGRVSNPPDACEEEKGSVWKVIRVILAGSTVFISYLIDPALVTTWHRNWFLNCISIKPNIFPHQWTILMLRYNKIISDSLECL